METQNTNQGQGQNQGQQKRQEVDYATLDKVNVSFRRPAKWYMYVVKRVLKTKNTLDIRARPSAAAQVVRVCEALKRLGYVTYTNYYTTSIVEGEVLQRFLVVNVKKTKEFDKLYDDREVERKKIMETKDQGGVVTKK
jgi:hypothetical protein